MGFWKTDRIVEGSIESALEERQATPWRSLSVPLQDWPGHGKERLVEMTDNDHAEAAAPSERTACRATEQGAD